MFSIERNFHKSFNLRLLDIFSVLRYWWIEASKNVNPKYDFSVELQAISGLGSYFRFHSQNLLGKVLSLEEWPSNHCNWPLARLQHLVWDLYLHCKENTSSWEKAPDRLLAVPCHNQILTITLYPDPSIEESPTNDQPLAISVGDSKKWLACSRLVRVRDMSVEKKSHQ